MPTNTKIKNLPIGCQSVIGDEQPICSLGIDLGFSPTDLLLYGSAMCKVATVRFIVRKNGRNIGSVEADVLNELSIT